ncbi:MAG TPA: hypothetical protein VLZ81_07765, partial [Blastocatellia bacterium]|nr:hypothetical protein [Blastocatellia bacterium]
MKQPARAILAIDTSGFGESLPLLPSMDALRRAYPNARIVAAATAGTVELLTSYHLIDDAINLGAGASGQSIGKTILEELKLAKRTQHMRFDLLLAFSGLSLVQFLFRLRMRSRIISPLIKPA